MPIKRTHGKLIILTVPNRKLILVVLERKELVGSIEVFIVFSMAPFDLSVMSWRIWPNELVLDSQLLQSCFKQCELVRTLRQEPVCKLRAIIRLDTFDGIGKFLNTV